ncbi:hypothetical protein [Ramlibacter sp.]|uniref:hypothetical protein n=1 Tax=Ramlibacter sp. TaxID=1917967 RepID=UPI00263782AC|nr:hypothetical protein [Ramlibacter sp.]
MLLECLAIIRVEVVGKASPLLPYLSARFGMLQRLAPHHTERGPRLSAAARKTARCRSQSAT